jgi:hypothetical protein
VFEMDGIAGLLMLEARATTLAMEAEMDAQSPACSLVSWSLGAREGGGY